MGYGRRSMGGVASQNAFKMVTDGKHTRKGLTVEIRVRRCLCEAVLWCLWRYRGDLEPTSVASALELEIKEFEHFVRCYPSLCSMGITHGPRFVEMLNTDHCS